MLGKMRAYSDDDLEIADLMPLYWTIDSRHDVHSNS